MSWVDEAQDAYFDGRDLDGDEDAEKALAARGYLPRSDESDDE